MDRPVAAAGNVEDEAKRFAVWKDVIGLDSEYDYDPVWAECLELNIRAGVSVRRAALGSPAVAVEFVYNALSLMRMTVG
jgi:hypothetical protein